jgi:hypothetical protein
LFDASVKFLLAKKPTKKASRPWKVTRFVLLIYLTKCSNGSSPAAFEKLTRSNSICKIKIFERNRAVENLVPDSQFIGSEKR